MLRSLHRNIKIRLFESFLNALLGCMVFPFMIIYFAEHFGEVCSGILTAVNVSLGAASGFYGGHLSDKFGRRRVLMASTLVQCGTFTGMALTAECLPIITLLCCTVNSVVFGFCSPASQALILDATTEKDRKFVYGLQYWSFNLAFLIGAFVGGLLFVDHKALLMGTMVCGSLLSFCLLKFFIQELHTAAEKPKNIVGSYFTILKDRTFVLFSLGAALLVSVEFQVRNYIAVKFAARDELLNYSILVSENTTIVVVLGLVSSYLISKISHQKALVFGGILFIGGLSLLAGFTDIWTLILLMGIGTIGELLLVPAEQAIIADLIPADTRSSYMAVGNVFSRMSIILGSLSVTIGHFLSSWQMVGLFAVVGSFGLSLVILSYQKRKPCTPNP